MNYRIGVLSDTHVSSLADAANLAELLLNGPFRGVDAILHAGDHVCPELESCFYPLPWYGVRGNMDMGRSDLPDWRIIDFAPWRIGLIHGWGAAAGIEKRVLTVFADQDIDILVFGHSHQPLSHRQGKLLLFNPGSPTQRRGAPFHSVGVLHLGDVVNAEIIRLD